MTEEIEARAKLTEQKRKRQFEELREYLEEEVPDSVTEKSGNSAVTRFAIKLAHEKMEELQQEKEMSMKEFQRIERKMKQLGQNV